MSSMGIAAVQTGPNEVTLNSGKKLILPGPVRSILVDSDSVTIRYGRDGEVRDRVWGFDRTGLYKWNGQVYPFAWLRVSGDRRTITLPGGAVVTLPAELTSFTQVEPALFVLVYDRNLGDPNNVVAYRSDGSQAWRIGESDGEAPGPFEYAQIDEAGILHAYSGPRGFEADMSPQTGAILARRPYR